MRKGYLTIFLALVLALFLISPLFVSGAKADAKLSYVTDIAGLLTEEQTAKLEKQAGEIASKYNCGLYIITVDDYSKYSAGSSIFDYACSVYGEYELGIGPEHTGMLLMLSTTDRDYALAAFGNDAHSAFTDYGKDILSDRFCSNFGVNDWYGGFCTYLDVSEDLLYAFSCGEPVDIYSDSRGYEDTGVGAGGAIFIIFFFPGLIALIACTAMKGKMKSAVKKSNANSYITPNGVSLYASRDQFTHITQSRVRKETSSPVRSGGGGGTHISSSGFSGKSGKF